MADRRIHVLGPMHICFDGRPVRLAGRLTRALLARLVIARGRAVSTDRLVEELWNGEPPSKATAVLQVHVHNLRRLFEPDRPARAPATVVVSEGLGYALRLPDTDVDAWQFESLLDEYLRVIRAEHPPEPAVRLRMLDVALQCWDGRALESFADYAWAAAETERLTDLHLTAGEMRAEAALELDRTTEVIGALRCTVEERPDREESVRLLALAQYRLGRQTEALATLRRTSEFLTREMGLDPGSRIQALETAILNQTDPSSAGAGPTATITAAGPATTAAECGYSLQRELALQASLEAAEHGARLVWVCGGPGFGKTTLTSAVSTELTRRGWTVATGSCPQVEGGPPAWVWAEIATRFGADPDARPDPLGPFEIAQVLAGRCRTAMADGPLLLVLEDLHRADKATMQILRQTVSWLHDQPLLVIATLRTTEAPDTVRESMAALAEPTAAYLELAGVDPEGVRAIAHTAGLADIGSDSLTLLHRRTGGNPLFLRELTAAMATGADVRDLLPTTRGVIEQQLARLPGPVRDVLAHVAVCGDRVDAATLVSLTGLAESVIIEHIGSAELAGIVAIDHDGRIRFAHDLIQDTVRASIPQLRRIRMQRSALELLDEQTSPEGTAVAVSVDQGHCAVALDSTDMVLGRIVTGPVDEILADLASACGDCTAVLRNRAAARRLRNRFRIELAAEP
ncbi:BTAD domain-containing putative transcriptional regulator [Nocardia vermiculata]|uniref:AAA family ATPase n=1 Tax=Nocardia vermiculata TaxID=257274 RepID=A0A846XS95_9NOCA|nr:BTAD domain-containing putative transcriptional regulator [Nocardia vermiculata]NKY48654.1 AAA family ATPase [Nocardia vermiculata]